jgi:hypothetical protein
MAQDRANSGNEYWLHKDSKGAINYLSDVHNRWTLWNNSPVRMAWVRNFVAYYSALIQPNGWDTSMMMMGYQGELLKLFSPKARSLVRQLITLLTKRRLSFQAQAQSSGVDILNDVKLANAVMDQIIENEFLNKKEEDLIEIAIVFGSAYMRTAFRTDLGEPFLVDEGRILRTGQPCIDVFTPLDVFFDIDIASWDRMSWVEVRSIKNRWELIADHPALEEEILAIPSWYDTRGPNYWFDQQNVNNPDLVAIYECYAKPSNALPPKSMNDPMDPGGRMIIYGSDTCVFYDGPNTYGCIPVQQLLPERIQSTSLGYPKLTDLLGLQEVFDNTISAIATNLSTFGVQSVTIPRDSDINVTALSGMNLISFTPMENVHGGGRPEALQLTQSPPEAFKMLDITKQEMSDYSGIHPIMQGDAKNVSSGAMAATLSANAVEYMDSLSKGLNITLERVMMDALVCLKRFGKIPRKVSMTGKSNQVYEKEFVGEDLGKVIGVKILVSNPLMQTTSGRLEICQQIMSVPPDFLPTWLGILEGKPLESITKGALNQSDLVYMENERLLSGMQTPSLITDDHAYHIQKHAELLNDPEMRMESDKLQVIMDHILGHQELMRQADPELAMIIKTGQMPPVPAQNLEQLEKPPGMSNQMATPAVPAKPAKDALGRPAPGGA